MKSVFNVLVTVMYGMLGLSTYIMWLDGRYLSMVMFLLAIYGLHLIKKFFKLGVYKYDN